MARAYQYWWPEAGVIRCTDDGVVLWIPTDQMNPDYRKFLQDVAAGVPVAPAPVREPAVDTDGVFLTALQEVDLDLSTATTLVQCRAALVKLVRAEITRITQLRRV